ncbi:hypothetical protein V6N11_054619 [Hibiscus sabdariffa]|uniref:Uncharacterized protein n=1 Tax=Hibiscus sabdariffa TaxID=183260 RepID=A0ABR2S4F7_9ROSI
MWTTSPPEGFRQHLHGFSSKPICLKMASEGVLLYLSDEHVSSHIDEGQIEEQRIRRRGPKIKEPSGHIHYYLQLAEVHVPMEFPLAGRWRHNLRNAGVVHNNVRDIRVLIQTVGKDHCGDRVLRQFNYHQPILRSPPARQHIHSVRRGRFDENWTIKQAVFISVWEERHMRWAEDLSPLQASDFEFNTEYYSWFLENEKPFLVYVEVGNKWREDLRCSKHRHLTSEFGQSSEEPNFDCSSGWPSSWNSVEDPSIHVSNNPWEQPPFGNVSEQPPMYCGNSSSQHAYTDDGGSIPQMDYMSITDSLFIPEQMHGTPPSMQLDDQRFNDEQTPDQPRRIVHPLRRYD